MRELAFKNLLHGCFSSLYTSFYMNSGTMPMDTYLFRCIQTCGVAPPCELPIIIMRIPGFSNALSLHLVVNCCHKMAQLQQSVNFVELQ